MINYLDDHVFEEDVIMPPTPYEPPDTLRLSSKELDDLSGFDKLPQWRIVMRVVVAHCDAKTAADNNLFGLLGDAPVQIIDASDAVKIEVYMSFAEECERTGLVTTGQDFRRMSAVSLQHRLRNVIMKRYHAEEIARKMRPAIMFRLCTHMCHQIKQDCDRDEEERQQTDLDREGDSGEDDVGHLETTDETIL